MTDEAKSEGFNQTLRLRTFVEENHKLISVLGIFSALTVFAGNIPIKGIGYFLSFVFMTMTVLLWLELRSYRVYVEGSKKGLAHWFGELLDLAILALVFNWVLEFRTFYMPFLWMPILLFLGWLTSKLLGRTRTFGGPTPQKGWQRFLVFVGSIVILFALARISIAIAAVLVPHVNSFVDSTRAELNRLYH